MFFFKQNDKKVIFKFGILSAVAETIYIALVATFLYYIPPKILPGSPAILGISTFLLVFVFSAAISGFFILGYPAYLLLWQKKLKEAVLTFLITLGTLIVLALLAVILILLIK